MADTALFAERAATSKPQPSRLTRLLRGTALGAMLAATVASPAIGARTAAAPSTENAAITAVANQDENLPKPPTFLYQADASFIKKLTPDNKARLEAPIYVLNELGYGNITQIVVDPRCMFDEEKSVRNYQVSWEPRTKTIHYPYMKDQAGIEACVDKVLESKVNADKLKAAVARQDIILVTTYLPLYDRASHHPVAYMLLSDEMKAKIPNWEEVLKEINKKGYADPDKPHSTEPENYDEFKKAGFGPSGAPFEMVVSKLMVRDKIGPMFQLLAQAQGLDLPLVTPELVKEETGIGYP